MACRFYTYLAFLSDLLSPHLIANKQLDFGFFINSQSLHLELLESLRDFSEDVGLPLPWNLYLRDPVSTILASRGLSQLQGLRLLNSDIIPQILAGPALPKILSTG